ncbi:hypothetical protein [Thermoflavimicrobium dichotomicum]|uniref:DUF5668 domain-containing protein n=1 Tax=Thermoflavimicrobium dichotomicum TaxID=46223 RepID=A0A1I3R975_9BACL|nr:hypothetical protein [Thermoflavimicrobium dichotomicum]SFJ42600.1 hypothetical protein SAMN05421852_10973 [Thermoflavimicrobium dichotomicum]
MQKKIIGFILVLAGVLLLLVQTGKAEMRDFVTWRFLGLLLCVFLLFFFFIKQQGHLVLLFGVGSAIFLFAWGKKYLDDWPTHWSILILMFGLSVILSFFVSKQQMALIVGIALTLIGIFAWPGIREIPGLASIADVLNTYWPALILGLGLLFLFKK